MPFVRYLGTKGLITAHQPVELVTDGDMTVPGSWTQGTGWSIAAGVATATAGAASDLEQDVSATEALTYNLVYDVTRTAGSITPKVAGTAGIARSTSGTFIEEINAGSGLSPRLELSKDSSFAGTVDNVSLSLGTNQWDLEFSILAGQEPESRDTSGVNSQYSKDGTQAQTTVNNSPFYVYTVSAKPIIRDSAEYLQWREFFRSTEEHEEFQLDISPTSTASVPVDEKIAKMTGSWTFQQTSGNLVIPSFTCRVLSDV